MCTSWRLKYSSSCPRNSDISKILDITITTDPTTDIGHTALKEAELEVQSYNRAARGYLHRRLSNGNICLKRGI